MSKQHILSFWRDVEIFALPDLSSEAKLTGTTLPWELPYEPRDNATLRHLVFFGKHRKQDIINAIEKVIDYSPGEEDEWIEKPGGHTCMAVMILNEQGQPADENAYLQASYLHGLKCLHEGMQLSGINERLKKVQEQFLERYAYNTAAANITSLTCPVITWDHLKREIRLLNELNIPGVHCTDKVYVQTTWVSKKSKPDTAFLNSFYLDDLNTLLSEQDNLSEGLNRYLASVVKEEDRQDILEDGNAFFNTINPALMPTGRWPSNPDHGLYTAQTGAVNASFNLLQENGLMGINGPPGTGKTTLLADIVANIVVQRAEKLLKTPSNTLFSGYRKLKREPIDAYYYLPDKDIFDDAGIVVASNNNAAVENISKELPDINKIDSGTFPEADYFSAFSQNLIQGKSWGLLAAALGNAENKQAFKNNFWYKQEEGPGFAAYLQSLYNNPEKEDRTAYYQEKAEEAKRELAVLLDEYRKFQKHAVRLYQALPAYLQDIAAESEATRHINTLTASREELMLRIRPVHDHLSDIRDRLSTIMQRIEFHKSVRPSFFFLHRLFRTRTFKQWNSTYILLIEEYNGLAANHFDVKKEFDHLNAQIKKLEKDIASLQQQLLTIRKRIEQYIEDKTLFRKQYDIDPENIPDEHLFQAFHTDKKAFHKSTPWSSPSINILRSRIFLTSLKLHEYLIQANAKQFKNNINLLMELMDGKVEVSLSLATLLWRTFFFCVPVVSTALASVSRLFGSLGRESIGWLLIDEAGQATPQSAAGIIYRARRSIIIGDPLQIEPVVTIPKKLVAILRNQNGVDTRWSPLSSSAQLLADRVTSYGTYMENGWSGFPLRTHRRCNNPMFDIANEIAYNGQMVKSVKDIAYQCPLGESAWFDVAGSTVENKQVVLEEIELLKEKVRILGRQHKEIFVISPFKAVARKCREAMLKINPDVQCGTIHTFQGKEADIVFLVLGSAPDKPGSRTWVSSKVNMLNVALTRAKRRFYVIGNKKLWKSYPYFSTVARQL